MTPEEPRRRPRRGVSARTPEAQGVDIPFTRKNYILFGVAAVVILAGYVALSRGSITLAPILLLLGYLVLIPWGILAK
jgi:hypothetical protein